MTPLIFTAHDQKSASHSPAAFFAGDRRDLKDFGASGKM